jgi:hypothetical protein
VSKKTVFLSGLFVFAGAVLGAQQQTTPRAGAPTTPVAPNLAAQQPKSMISGTVTKAGTGEPVRKASVTLMPNAGGGGQGNRGQQGGPGQLPQPGPGQQQGQLGQQGGQPQNQPGQAGQAQNAQQGQQRGAGAGSVRSVTTGDDGSFSFPDIAAGTYRVRVDRDGFLSQEYGQRSWTGTGLPVTVQAGQTLSTVNFQLIQGGTIAGRILDENLEPVTGIQVQALTYSYQNGTRNLVSERQVQTNDLGEYRLYWLTPGEHFVSAIPNARRGGLVQSAQQFQQRGGGGRGGQVPAVPSAQDGPEETYAATFYPGGIDPETAIPVRVPAATELRGIDFVLRPTPTARVSGRVVGMTITPTTQQLQQQAQQQAQQGRGGRGGNANNENRGGGRGQGGSRIQVLLTRIGASAGGGRGQGGGGGRGGGGRGGGPGGNQFQAPVNADGTFEIANVIPGAYNLIAVQQAPGQIYSTRTRLDVGPGGVSGINLAVRPGVEIPGQIYVEGTAPATFQMNRLRVGLQTQDNLPLGNTVAQVDATGKFTLANVPAMSYRVQVQGLPAGAYLLAGRFGSTDALGDTLQVDSTGTLSLQIGFSPGTVTGTVTDNRGQPVPSAITVLIPSARNRLDLYKTTNSDPSGNVNFTNVAPGDYKVIAWEDVPQGAYLNADFVQPFEDRAQSVHVERNTSPSVQVKVIPRNEQ